jgi:glycosyltransferase involved in cell wall biosynthesis
VSRWNYLRGVAQIRKQLRTKSYDLTHAHFGLAGWVARFQSRVPLVVTFHGDDALGRPGWDGRITPMGRLFQVTSFVLARWAAAVIVQSREMRRVLRWEAAEVIPCGIDLDLFQPVERAEACRLAGLDSAKKYVLFAYNPAEPRKRFDLVKAAVEKARAQVPQLELLLLRGKPHSQVALYMNAADVAVVASWLEGGPLVTKEAMATNLPVVTVNVGDAVDLIREADGNYIVPREAGAMAAKIVEICRHGIRAHGRERLRPYSVAATAQRLVEVYARVVSKGRSE